MRLGPPQRSRLHEPEERSYLLLFVALCWLVVLGLGPIAAVWIASMFTGVYEGEEGFPAFTTLSPSLAVPAILIAIVIVRTFPAPLKHPHGMTRGEITFVAFVGLGIATTSFAFDTKYLGTAGATFMGLVLAAYALLTAVSLLRSVAGWLRLVPESWRVERASQRKRATRKP
ncbi:hypothetical protein [Demequina sp. NBRC 110057]|uniref:hypothetical protein n=1 Tax=Demequina sp. NBRC 110057 TaxID=1570346 RepID=UPI0009FD9F4F|nr:hypothetical protein [Demequina sp. NBRC 110057]